MVRYQLYRVPASENFCKKPMNPFKPGRMFLLAHFFLHNMIPPTYLPLQASADACATQGEAGLGGILRLNGEVAAWFAFTISHAEAKDVFPWISDSMQKHINVWELLGQFALAFCLDRALKGRCTPISVTFACDNTSAEAAHLKALSTASGMCHVLAAFFRFQRIHNLDVSIQHIPGMWNDEADALSRGKHLPHCTPELQVDVPWTWLCSFSSRTFTIKRQISAHFVDPLSPKKWRIMSFAHRCSLWGF